MEEKHVSSLYCEVTEPEAVKVLMDRNQVQLLRPFFEGEKTISEAAEVLELRLQFLFRKVQRFAALGLLVVSREQVRKGRALRYYRTSAPLFYVPASSVDMGTLLRRSEDFWNRHLTDSLLSVWNRRTEEGLGVQVYPNTLGGVRIALATEPGVTYRALEEDEAVMLNSWLRLSLSPQDAKVFQRDVEALVERYTNKHREGNRANYIARFALAPLTDE